MKRKTIRNILLVLFVLAVAAAIYIYKEYNRTHKDTASLKPDHQIGALALIQEFEADASAGSGKYVDKIVEVNGAVKNILKDEKGYYTVVLGDTSTMSSVRCSMDSTVRELPGSYTMGSKAIIKGVCTGFNADELLGSDVILIRCVPVDK